MARQVANKTAGDPWCIGYFIDNELEWGPNGRGIALRVLKAKDIPAKQAFITDLKAKYSTIEAMNQAWATSIESWDALLRDSQPADPANAAVAADCTAFGNKLVETYFRIVRDEVKAVAPHNLYLGCRFHGHKDLPMIEIAARYCDVISCNIYTPTPHGILNQYTPAVDMPFIIGEFGVGSDPTQTPFRGDNAKSDPDERARLLQGYMERAFAYPYLVGAHFFQYQDQALSGRPDGEAILRGFVNCADVPHADLVQTNRRMAYDMYQKRAK